MLQRTPAPSGSARQLTFVLRKRFEFLGALLFAAGLPWVYGEYFASEPLDPTIFLNSLIANVLAICLALWMRISVSTYPGIRSGQVILPAIVAAHAAVVALVVLLRIPYHRSALVQGFLIHLVWAYAMYFVVLRRVRQRICIVPFGSVDGLKKIDTVDWDVLARPDLKEADGFGAIVADFSAHLPDEWEAFLADAAVDGRVVYQVEQLSESLTGRVEVTRLSENSFGSLVPMRAYSAIKHLGDFLLAVVVLPIALPLLAGSALAILLLDGRPVLFRQRRIGQSGKEIVVTKFRTMQAFGDLDPESREAAMTGDADVRITPVGGFLRRSRLDELPQIFNVLKGEMSWIGPRPEAQVLSTWYTGEIPFYRYRHVVRPGISGWAQVNQGHVAEVDAVHLKLQYDFFYIKYFSPWLDLLILFRTIKTMLTGFGSR